MPKRPPVHRPHNAPDSKREYDAQRPSAHRRGYGAGWRKIRERVLRHEPLCREHLKRGEFVEATEVDHITPRSKGGTDDRSNLQSLCKPCHSRKTAKEDGRWG